MASTEWGRPLSRTSSLNRWHGPAGRSFERRSTASTVPGRIAITAVRTRRRATFSIRSTIRRSSQSCSIHSVQTALTDAILLFDGVFLQRDEFANSWDFRIWVEAPFDVTVSRAVRRDAAGDPEAPLEAKYRRRYVPGQIMYLTQCSPRETADVVVNNAVFENPDLSFGRPMTRGQ